MDTTNILFIRGGAFDGLDKIIESRRTGVHRFDSPVEKEEADLGVVRPGGSRTIW